MTKLIIGAIIVLGGIATKVLVWYWSPGRKNKLDRTDRDNAHKANANKDSAALDGFFRRRRRR